MATNIKTIGIIGAGQMGGGIAHVSALAGYDIFLNDLSDEKIESGLATINGNLARQVASEKISRDWAKPQAVNTLYRLFFFKKCSSMGILYPIL